MAGVRDDRQRVFSPAKTSGRRSPAVLIMLLLAVFAAIALMWNISRRSVHRVAPMASVENVVETAEPAAELPVAAAAAPESAPAAAAPAPAIDQPGAAGNEAEIAGVISEGRPGLTRCYQRALVRDATMVRGDLTVRLSVAPSGRVGAVNISGPAAFRAMQPCLKDAISKWSFPAAASSYAAEFELAFRGKE